MASQGKQKHISELEIFIIIISFGKQMWNEFFDDMLNPKGEEKSRLPSLLKWREKFINLFNQVSILLCFISKDNIHIFAFSLMN